MNEGPYQLWKNTMLIWIVFTVVGTVLTVVGTVFGVGELVGKIILATTGLGLGLVGLGALAAEMWARWRVLRQVRAVVPVYYGYWYWRLDQRIPSENWYHIMFEIARKGDFVVGVHDIANEVRSKLNAVENHFTLKIFEPYIFMTLRPKGMTGLAGWKKSRGIARGRWMEVEYLPENMPVTRSLIGHEFAHVFLMRVYPGLSEGEQHAFMKRAGIP